MGNVSEKRQKSEGVQVPQTPGTEQQPSSLHQDGGQDEAVAAFEGLDEGVIIDKATDRRLVRKIDVILMPVSTLYCMVHCVSGY